MSANNNIINFDTPPRILPDEVTYNKIQRHLNDINDTITDDDLRNIKTDLAPYYSIDALKKDKAFGNTAN